MRFCRESSFGSRREVRESLDNFSGCVRFSEASVLTVRPSVHALSLIDISTCISTHTRIPATMSRKGVGLAAFDRSRITSAQYASHGNNLRSSHSTSLATQLSVFRSLLQQFAQTHAKDIRSNPSFRAEFARMCAAIGVDPLASSSGAGGKDGSGSFWSQLLGGSVNDFYFELAVRVVEVCGASREENGGLIGVKEVRDRIMSTKIEGSAEITE